MPDSKNHTIINIIVLIVIVSGFYALITSDGTVPVDYKDVHLIAIFSLFYLFGTHFLSPDLDIDSTPYKRWGVFRFLWWPYKVLFKHRGLSHHPIFGPLAILANFVLILIPVLVVVGFKIYWVPVDMLASMMFGMVLSIEMHILADMVVSELY